MTNLHSQEIELKLALPPGEADAFLKRMARRRSAPVRQQLVTLYFDTPDFALSAAGVALRVRRAGRRWLQTLKTEGERQGGLSTRAEFEMPVAGGVPDWSRFPPEALAYVPDPLRGQIVPVFETRFHRTAWLLKGRGAAQIEVALDVGEVVAGERRQPICEIELELKRGQPDALFALALDWAGDFGCLPFDISKAERGVKLAHGVEPAPVKAVALTLDDGMSVEDGFAAIVQACLAQFQANLPGVLYPLPLPPPQPRPPLPLAGEGGERARAHPEGHEGANVMPTAIASRPSPQPSPQRGEGAKEPKTGPLPNPLPQAGEHPEGHEGAKAGPKAIDDDIEYVHQARVALRRLRAALRLFRRVCVLPDELLDGLRGLAAALGAARDWDVLCSETLPAIAPHYPEPARWRSGVAVLEAHRAEVRTTMRAALAEARPGAWLLAMQRWLLQHGWRAAPDGGTVAEAQRFEQLSLVDKWARRALKQGHRRVKRGARAFAELQPLERHALRIAIKRQRYAGEFFETLFAAHSKRDRRRQTQYLAVLRDAQDSLGRANDARIAAELMAAAPPETGPMADFVRGWLAAKLADTSNGESAVLMQGFLDTATYW